MDCRGGENRPELGYDVEIESIGCSDAPSAGVKKKPVRDKCQSFDLKHLVAISWPEETWRKNRFRNNN